MQRLEEGLVRGKNPGLWSGLMIIGLCMAAWAYALFFATTEIHQGEVYRILYLHVPSAFSAFLCALILFLCSIQGLRGRNQAMPVGRATAEVGLLFTVVTLVTGSIWGKPTWGVWWTWDARLTTTLILSLLYCGYLLLWSSLSTESVRTKVCSVLGILIFMDVPIIYKSVSWWRTLHQPPSLMGEGGVTMASEILNLLLLCCALTLGLALWMIWQRAVNLRLQAQLEKLSYEQWQSQELPYEHV